jgi:hypothetical protein
MPGKREYKLPKNLYCGAEELPDGKKYGTLEDCSYAGQVRLWNKYDITVQLIKSYETELEIAKIKIMDVINSSHASTKYALLIIDIKNKIKELKKELKDLEKHRKETFEAMEKDNKKRLDRIKKAYK